MIPKKILLITWFALVLTVPWWFLDGNTQWFDLPAWVTYAVFSAITYSCILGWIIQKYWHPEDDTE